MDLKYISKNDGYIIDRKFTDPEEINEYDTYIESGEMVLSEILPIDDEEMEKSVTEFAFDSMKDRTLKNVKKKYLVSNDEICNFYFEGDVKKDDNKTYAKFKDKEIAMVYAKFNLNFEVEVKVTRRNFLKVYYNKLVYKANSI